MITDFARITMAIMDIVITTMLLPTQLPLTIIYIRTRSTTASATSTTGIADIPMARSPSNFPVPGAGGAVSWIAGAWDATRRRTIIVLTTTTRDRG